VSWRFSVPQDAELSRITELLFADVLCSWAKSLSQGEGGLLGALADPHIGKALQLIHERPERSWTLSQLGRSVGLGRSALSARFTRFVGRPVHRYLVAFRMEEAAFMLKSSDVPIAQIAPRVGYRTTTAFSKAFQQHYGLSPGRYRTRKAAADVS
jgi:transcriptional regulator GlxA family with amidase domain